MADDINISIGTDTINVTVAGGSSRSAVFCADTLVNLDGGDTVTGIKYNSSDDAIEIYIDNVLKAKWK